MVRHRTWCAGRTATRACSSRPPTRSLSTIPESGRPAEAGRLSLAAGGCAEHRKACGPAGQRAVMPDGCSGLIGRTVEAVVFTWEGAAVRAGRCLVGPVRRRVAALSAAGVHVAVISESGVAHLDGQLRLRPPGPGRLLLCVNRGSEMFGAGSGGLGL